MEENKTNQEKTALTYEQLNMAATQLSAQVRQLKEQLADQNFYQLCKRLDYLFMVLDKASFFDEDFVQACAAEIKMQITPPEEITEEKE
jgi:hypothetical protein